MFNFTNIVKDQTSHEVKINEENHAPFEISNKSKSQNTLTRIFDEYKQWKHLFLKKITTKTLLKHQTWNHEIIFELSKTFTFELIYALFEKKLRIFREYLNENLKKKFIRKSQSSTKYSILFVSKKNEKLRLCVDYRKLNEITIKNRYSLSNINELQNRLSKAKYFIKLDLKKAYNLIRMKTKKKWKIIFRIRYEHYEYIVMSFELINVSTICQEMINDALREHLNVFVIAYFDDIVKSPSTKVQEMTWVWSIGEVCQGTTTRDNDMLSRMLQQWERQRNNNDLMKSINWTRFHKSVEFENYIHEVILPCSICSIFKAQLSILSTIFCSICSIFKAQLSTLSTR